MSDAENGPRATWSPRARERLEELTHAWSRSPRETIPRLRRLRLPGTYGARDHAAPRSALELHADRCRAGPGDPPK